MSSPVFLYAFGPSRGPFKVGFTSYPRMRAYGILSCEPGATFGRPDGAMRYLLTLPNREGAEAAEGRAHSILADHRVRGEWFAAQLGVVVAAMRQAAPGAEAARPPKRALPREPMHRSRALVTAAECQAINEVRFADRLDSRADAIRVLLREALERRGMHLPPPTPRQRGGDRRAPKGEAG